RGRGGSAAGARGAGRRRKGGRRGLPAVPEAAPREPACPDREAPPSRARGEGGSGADPETPSRAPGGRAREDAADLPSGVHSRRDGGGRGPREGPRREGAPAAP